MLACLNHHVYIVFEVVFTLVDDSFVPGIVICWFVCSRRLAVAGYYYYYCLFDNQKRPHIKVEGARNLPLGRCTGRQVIVSGIICTMYILYLRNVDAILVILCIGLLITTTIAGE